MAEPGQKTFEVSFGKKMCHQLRSERPEVFVGYSIAVSLPISVHGALPKHLAGNSSAGPCCILSETID